MRVAVKTDDFCPRCANVTEIFGKVLCSAGVAARPLETMRHPDAPCGTNAEMFRQKDSGGLND